MVAYIRFLNENVGVILFLILWVLILIALKVKCLHRDFEAVHDAHGIVKMHRQADEDGLANYDKKA